MTVLEQIEALNTKYNTLYDTDSGDQQGKVNGGEQKTQQNESLWKQLARSEGDAWSPLVYEEIRGRYSEVRDALIDTAKEASDWQSLVQVLMTVLATFALVFVWLKLARL